MRKIICVKNKCFSRKGAQAFITALWITVLCSGTIGSPQDSGLDVKTKDEYRESTAVSLEKASDSSAQFGAQGEEIRLSETAKQFLLRHARRVCNGDPLVLEHVKYPDELRNSQPSLILIAYKQDGGRYATKRIDGQKTPLVEKVEQAVTSVCRRTNDVYLHLLIVSFTARFNNWGLTGFLKKSVFEPQVYGLAYELRNKRVEIDPMQAVEHSMESKTVRAVLAKRLGVDPKSMPLIRDLMVEIYKVIHFGEGYPDRDLFNYYRGQRVFTVDQLNHDEVERRLGHIATWYRNNTDDQVQYQYHIQRQAYLNKKRTMVRSTMAVWVLNRLAYYKNDEELKRLGKRTIDYYLENYFNMALSLKKGKIIPSKKPIPKGELVKNRWTTASFLAAALLERDDYQQYLTEIDLLMTWAMDHEQEDGFLWTQFGISQFFMPGQLLLAVAYAYEKTQDEKYKGFFDRIFKTYGPQIEAMLTLGDGYFTPYAPAWFTQPLAHMYLLTGDKKYRDIVYSINDNVARWFQLNSNERRHFDYDGVLLMNRSRDGNSSITAASLESLVDAAIVAKKDGDSERYKRYSKIIPHTVAQLFRLQYLPENTYWIPQRHRVLGGFKRTMFDSLSWMDNVWHFTSALTKIQRHKLLLPY